MACALQYGDPEEVAVRGDRDGDHDLSTQKGCIREMGAGRFHNPPLPAPEPGLELEGFLPVRVWVLVDRRHLCTFLQAGGTDRDERDRRGRCRNGRYLRDFLDMDFHERGFDRALW